MFGIEPQVQQDLRVVHVIGKVSWRRKVTVCHHLFGAVDNDRVIDVCSARLWLLLCTKGKGEGRKSYLCNYVMAYRPTSEVNSLTTCKTSSTVNLHLSPADIYDGHQF